MSVLTVNGATAKTDILILLEAMETGKMVGKPENIHIVGLCNLSPHLEAFGCPEAEGIFP